MPLSAVDVANGLAVLFPDDVVTDVECLTSGMETQIFGFALRGRGARLILRVYGSSADLPKAVNEFTVLGQLRTAGYPVPQVLSLEESSARFGGPYLIMERIPGRPLTAMPDRTEVLPALMTRLHSLDWRPFAQAPAFDPGAIRPLPFGPLLLNWLDRRAEAVAFRRCLIHGDFHSGNVLIRPDGEPVVIDWSYACVDDPRLDLANSMALETAMGRPTVAAALRAACAARWGGAIPDMDYFEARILCFRVGQVAFLRDQLPPEQWAGAQDWCRMLLDRLASVTGLPLPSSI